MRPSPRPSSRAVDHQRDLEDARVVGTAHGGELVARRALALALQRLLHARLEVARARRACARAAARTARGRRASPRPARRRGRPPRCTPRARSPSRRGLSRPPERSSPRPSRSPAPTPTSRAICASPSSHTRSARRRVSSPAVAPGKRSSSSAGHGPLQHRVAHELEPLVVGARLARAARARTTSASAHRAAVRCRETSCPNPAWIARIVSSSSATRARTLSRALRGEVCAVDKPDFANKPAHASRRWRNWQTRQI